MRSASRSRLPFRRQGRPWPLPPQGGRSQSQGLAGPPHRHPAGKRRELDDAAGPRLRRLSLPPRADPVGRLVSREHVADASDATVGVADHGEPFECEGGPGTVSQQMLERLKVARHVAVEECDADARVDRKSAVLPGEHVGGGVRIEEPLPLEPTDHAAADPFGDRGQVCGRERPGGQERRRPVGAVRSRQEDAVGDGRVQMGVAVEPGAEAVEKGDGAEPWAGRPAHGVRPDGPTSCLVTREGVQILTTTRLASRRCPTRNDERGRLQGQIRVAVAGRADAAALAAGHRQGIARARRFVLCSLERDVRPIHDRI